MPIIVAEIITFIKPKMMFHELSYIYTILGYFITQIVFNLVNTLNVVPRTCICSVILIVFISQYPNPCRAQLLSLSVYEI